MGEVCTDAACAGPDLGKERGHQGDEVSPLTVQTPAMTHPRAPRRRSGQQGGTWSQSQVLRNSATNTAQKEGSCFIDTDGTHDSLRFPLSLKEALKLP